MASSVILRKDVFGQIISKDNYKNYHININSKIDIVNIKSYKIYNKIREGDYYDDELFEDENAEEEKKENILDDYEKQKFEECVNKDPHAFSKGNCLIF